MRPSAAAPPRDRAAVLAAALALLLLAGAPASGQETVPQTVPTPNPGAEGAPAAGPSPLPDTLAGAAGTWDLALAGGQRRCVLTLSTDSGPSGRLVRFPAGCRRALPLLAGITGWLFTEAGIRLVDANARPVLAFARSPDGQSLGASAENGERYSLVPLQIAAMRPPEPAAPPAAAPEAGAPAQVAAPPPEGPAPGLYAALGYNGRGVAMATVMGMELARWLRGGMPDMPVTDIRPIPFHGFWKLGVLAKVWEGRVRDRLGL